MESDLYMVVILAVMVINPKWLRKVSDCWDCLFLQVLRMLLIFEKKRKTGLPLYLSESSIFQLIQEPCPTLPTISKHSVG